MEAPNAMVKKIVPVIVALIALGGVYKFVIAKPPAKAAGSSKILKFLKWIRTDA